MHPDVDIDRRRVRQHLSAALADSRTAPRSRQACAPGLLLVRDGRGVVVAQVAWEAVVGDREELLATRQKVVRQAEGRGITGQRNLLVTCAQGGRVTAGCSLPVEG